MPLPAHLSAIPLDEPDARDRIAIKGRIVLVPRVWRRCPSGVTIDPPAELRERRPAAPRLTALERDVLAAIRAGSVRYDRGVGRHAVLMALYGQAQPPAHTTALVAEAIATLHTRGAITIEETRQGHIFRPAQPRDQEAA